MILQSPLFLGLAACVGTAGLPQAPWVTPALPAGWELVRPPHDVQALALQGGQLWGGGSEGLFRLDRMTMQSLPLPEGTPVFGVVRAVLAEGEVLWVGTQTGLYSYIEDQGWQEVKIGPDGLLDNRVNALYLDSQGRLWVGTWGGASYREGDNWHSFSIESGLLDNMVNVILEDRMGGMWFGSYLSPNGGLSRFYQGLWQHITTEDGLPHNNIVALLEAQDGKVWVGTGLVDKGGALALEVKVDGQFTPSIGLAKDDGLAGEKVRSLYQDDRGAIWFGSEYDGIAVRLPQCWRLLDIKAGLAHPEVKVMLPDPEGGLWLGTRDGINHLTAEAIFNINCP